MSPVRLIAQVGPSRGRAVSVVGPRFVIGRDPSCQLRAAAAAVSRFHAAIERRGGRMVLLDLGSTNGTLLNGRPIRGEEAELRTGDRVQVGPLVFSLAVGDSREEPAVVEDLVASWLRDRVHDEPADDGGAAATEDFAVSEQPDGPAPLKQEVIEDVVVVTPLVPDLDGDTATDALRAELLNLFERPVPRRVVVNLRYVGHLSGRAIGVLVAHHLRLDRAGGALRVCEAHARVAALLEQVQLAMMVECHPTLDDAVLTAWPGGSDDARRPAI
jgi:anti-anti-sigma factor